MRIVHIITRFIRGGADENTLLTCNGQAENGHEVYLIYGHEFHPDICGQLNRAVQQHRVSSLTQEIDVKKDIAALLQCAIFLRQLKPDLVHTHTSKAGIIGRFAAVLAGVPGIVHGVHILPFEQVSWMKRRLFIGLEKLAAQRTAAFLSVSPAMRDGCLHAGIGTPDRHWVVPSGMDVQRFRTLWPEAWRLVIDPTSVGPHDPQFIVLAATLEARKRQIDFLPVFHKIAQARPRVVLLLVGEGRERAAVEQKILELGLEGRAICLGFRPDLERILAIADICVCTSMREGLPRVLVQYVLAARPVVTVDLPGVREIVQDGQSGYVTGIDDLDEMFEPILRLLDQPKLRERMSAAATEVDLSAWNADVMVSHIEHIYTSIATSAGLVGQ